MIQSAIATPAKPTAITAGSRSTPCCASTPAPISVTSSGIGSPTPPPTSSTKSPRSVAWESIERCHAQSRRTLASATTRRTPRSFSMVSSVPRRATTVKMPGAERLTTRSPTWIGMSAMREAELAGRGRRLQGALAPGAGVRHNAADGPARSAPAVRGPGRARRARVCRLQGGAGPRSARRARRRAPALPPAPPQRRGRLTARRPARRAADQEVPVPRCARRRPAPRVRGGALAAPGPRSAAAPRAAPPRAPRRARAAGRGGLRAHRPPADRGRLHDGREVAIKIQYPEIARLVDGDLRNFAFLVDVLRRLERNLDLRGL